ncbi:MAG: hypothetical protein GWP10_03925 [Nitrospiraceae bacterium]|nr:hypothetical protein [Nitrospiraceae bacterium]
MALLGKVLRLVVFFELKTSSSYFVTDHRVLFLETICLSHVVFLAFGAWETLAPERSGGEKEGSDAAKALENKGREHVGRRSTL